MALWGRRHACHPKTPAPTKPPTPASLDDEGGAPSYSVLLQEYLQAEGSEEWVVDTVSRAGEHKVVALWRYDKGEANGAPFVYFGITPEPVGCAKTRRICEYATAALDALRWRITAHADQLGR